MVYMLSGKQESDHGSFMPWLRMAVSGLLGKEPHSHPCSAVGLSASLGVKQDTINSDKKNISSPLLWQYIITALFGPLFLAGSSVRSLHITPVGISLSLQLRRS